MRARPRATRKTVLGQRAMKTDYHALQKLLQTDLNRFRIIYVVTDTDIRCLGARDSNHDPLANRNLS